MLSTLYHRSVVELIIQFRATSSFWSQTEEAFFCRVAVVFRSAIQHPIFGMCLASSLRFQDWFCWVIWGLGCSSPGILTLLPRAWGRWNPQESPLFNLSRCSDWLPWNLRPENPICSGAVEARNPAREKSFCRWRCCRISSFQCDRFLTIERRTGHHIHAIADLEHLT